MLERRSKNVMYDTSDSFPPSDTPQRFRTANPPACNSIHGGAMVFVAFYKIKNYNTSCAIIHQKK